jgi:hypothetical protein
LSAVADAQQAAIQLSISSARSAGFFIGETMSKGTWAFRPTDLKRAIKAASSAGLEIARAEIEPQSGKIVLMFGKSVASQVGSTNEWDGAE